MAVSAHDDGNSVRMFTEIKYREINLYSEGSGQRCSALQPTVAQKGCVLGETDMVHPLRVADDVVTAERTRGLDSDFAAVDRLVGRNMGHRLSGSGRPVFSYIRVKRLLAYFRIMLPCGASHCLEGTLPNRTTQ